MNFAMVN